jgi:hypothetical protein
MEVVIMSVVMRKKSPRAPSIALNDAIEKACKIYEKDRCHAAPADGVAQHMGYKNAGNGAALQTMASLKYYGLLDRPKEGMAAVSKDVESYLFAPNDSIKQALITKWLRSPPIFAELLDKYAEGLPSDATLKFELIQSGFSPASADSCLQVFRKSVDYAHYYERKSYEQSDIPASEVVDDEVGQGVSANGSTPSIQTPVQALPQTGVDVDIDRIPVRLAGGRRAWIEIPMPFYDADKDRLKKQIDLLLTDDEEDASDLI